MEKKENPTIHDQPIETDISKVYQEIGELIREEIPELGIPGAEIIILDESQTGNPDNAPVNPLDPTYNA